MPEEKKIRSIKCPRGQGLLLNVPIPLPYVQNRQTLEDTRCIDCQLRVPEAPPTITLKPRVKNFGSDLFIDCGGQRTTTDLTPPKTISRNPSAVLPRGPFR